MELSKYKRLVAWFSCGAASAVATKLAIDEAKFSDIEVVIAYCDPGSEHPDNERFLRECQEWFGHPITVMSSKRRMDTWDVWEEAKYIAGINGAPCTTELKKSVRELFERPDDVQVFGFDSTEQSRAELFSKNQPEVNLWCPLIDNNVPKTECFNILQRQGIALPAMYLLGYKNNNCIGCPKGNAGYWNKIRRDFPAVFARMAELEDRLGAKICQATIDGVRQRVRLYDLPPTAGRYSDEAPISCGLLCDPDAFAEN